MRFSLPLLVAMVALSGCAGSELSSLASSSTDAPAKSDAFGGLGASAAIKDQPLTPFGAPDGAIPGRDVIENPTVAEIMLTGALPEMSWGRADAPVTVIKYASLTCPHCRKFHAEVFPELKRTYIDTGKVRFIMREFPIGKTSGTATVALRCAPPDKYLDLYGRYLAQQPSWVSQEVRLDPIFAVAKQVGMTRAQFDQCLANQSMIEGLKWVKDRGRKLGIIGTPNFFIAGKLVKTTLGAKELKDLVEAALAGRPAAAASAARP